MFVAYLRHLVCAVTGRVACNMGCGRPARCYGLCVKHLHGYRYTPTPAETGDPFPGGLDSVEWRREPLGDG